MNIKMNIAYDGRNYQGYQKNKNAKNTIQSTINNTFSKYFNKDIEIIASGRTDKGVSAHNQVINFRISNIDKTLAEVKKDLNHYLPKDIIIKKIEEVDDRFHSRFSSENKTYVYRVYKCDSEYPPLFERDFVYEYSEKVDVNIMKKAASLFVGEHDFKGFSTDKTKKSTVRKVNSLNITETDTEIIFEVNGDGFLYNMVRIMVGTLLEIGSKKRKINSIEEIFYNKVRSEAGFTVPADGLVLEDVFY